MAVCAPTVYGVPMCLQYISTVYVKARSVAALEISNV